MTEVNQKLNDRSSMQHRKIDDKTIMWFGKYKGKKLANVPAQYLLYLFYEGVISSVNPLWEYVEDNLDILQEENEKDFI
jgi:hypothetical protein